MTDLLFDLDAVASAKDVGARTHDLAADVATRATLRTKAASDAIARWAAARPLDVRSIDFSANYLIRGFGEVVRIAACVPMAGGGVLLCVRGDGGSLQIFVAARMGDEGVIVAFDGEELVPADLMPSSAESGRYAIASGVVEILGRCGAWLRVRTLRDNGVEAIERADNCLEIPGHLLSSEVAPVSPEAVSALSSLHHSIVTAEVADLLAQPRDAAFVVAAGRMLSRHARPGHHLSGAREALIPGVESSMKPLLDLLSWRFERDGWSLDVDFDGSMGYYVRISISGTHADGREVDEQKEFLSRNDAPLALWLSPETRDAQLVEFLNQSTSKDSTPVAAAPSTTSKKCKPSIAQAEQRSALQQRIVSLASWAQSQEQHDCLTSARAVAENHKSTSDDVCASFEAIHGCFAPLVASLMERVPVVMETQVWTDRTVAEAKDLLRDIENLSDNAYRSDLRDLKQLVELLDLVPEVVEVARGWWVARGRDSLHGAVSCTGYYSQAQQAEHEALIKHLMESPQGVVGHLKHLLQDPICSERSAAWLKTLKYAPEGNDARAAVVLIAECEANARAHAAVSRAAQILASDAPSAEDAQAAINQLPPLWLLDDDALAPCHFAQVCLEKRFGRTVKAGEQNATLVLEGVDDAECDEESECDDVELGEEE